MDKNYYDFCSSKYKCLICGYSELPDEPYTNNSPSYEMCPCCGFQYGLDDYHKYKTKKELFLEWRINWIDGGCKWFSKSILEPKDWNIKKKTLPQKISED